MKQDLLKDLLLTKLVQHLDMYAQLIEVRFQLPTVSSKDARHFIQSGADPVSKRLEEMASTDAEDGRQQNNAAMPTCPPLLLLNSLSAEELLELVLHAVEQSEVIRNSRRTLNIFGLLESRASKAGGDYWDNVISIVRNNTSGLTSFSPSPPRSAPLGRASTARQIHLRDVAAVILSSEQEEAAHLMDAAAFTKLRPPALANAMTNMKHSFHHAHRHHVHR